MRGKVVLFTRHAESIANAGQKTEDPCSIPLSEFGKQQAQVLADTFKKRPGLIVCSKHERTQATALPLRKKFNTTPALIWGIHEFSFLNPRIHAGTSAEERRPFRDAYWEQADPFYTDGGGAESFASFVERVKRSASKIHECQKESIVIFGHETFFLLFQFLAKRELLLKRHTPSACSLTKMMREFKTFTELNTVPNACFFDITHHTICKYT